MKLNHFLFSCGAAITVLSGSFSATAADDLPALVDEATQIVAARQGSASPIPESKLLAAKGVAILDITKAGFVVGASRGKGVVLVKNEHGLGGLLGLESWSAPIPIKITGGSIGAQIGKTETKTIVLLKTQAAVDAFTNPGELQWQAGATGTAGGDTRTQQAQGELTDADIQAYQQTDGLYGGAVFGGSQLAINDEMLHEAYGADMYLRDILEGTVPVPEYAERLVELLDGIR